MGENENKGINLSAIVLAGYDPNTPLNIAKKLAASAYFLVTGGEWYLWFEDKVILDLTKGAPMTRWRMSRTEHKVETPMIYPQLVMIEKSNFVSDGVVVGGLSDLLNSLIDSGKIIPEKSTGMDNNQIKESLQRNTPISELEKITYNVLLPDNSYGNKPIKFIQQGRTMLHNAQIGLEKIKHNDKHIVLLQGDLPLATSAHLDGCIDNCLEKDGDKYAFKNDFYYFMISKQLFREEFPNLKRGYLNLIPGEGFQTNRKPAYVDKHGRIEIKDAGIQIINPAMDPRVEENIYLLWELRKLLNPFVRRKGEAFVGKELKNEILKKYFISKNIDLGYVKAVMEKIVTQGGKYSFNLAIKELIKPGMNKDTNLISVPYPARMAADVDTTRCLKVIREMYGKNKSS